MYSDIFKQNTQIVWRGCAENSLKKIEDEEDELIGTPYDGYILKQKGFRKLVEKMQIVINNDFDFDNLKKYFKLSDVKKPLQISKYILATKGIPPHSYEIKLKSIKELNEKQLEYLCENGGDIKKIILADIPDASLRVNDFLGLKKAIDSITCGIKKDNADIIKFLEVYKIIGKNVEYKQYSNYIKAICKKEASCQGYSELLKLALNNIGMDCIIIRGNYKEPQHPDYTGHAWNQVKINDNWYNCDLTWDASKIKEGKKVKYCLRDDNYFQNENDHVTPKEVKEIHKVEHEYDQEIVNQYFIQDKCEER